MPGSQEARRADKGEGPPARAQRRPAQGSRCLTLREVPSPPGAGKALPGREGVCSSRMNTSETQKTHRAGASLASAWGPGRKLTRILKCGGAVPGSSHTAGPSNGPVSHPGTAVTHSNGQVTLAVWREAGARRLCSSASLTVAQWLPMMVPGK